MIGSTATTSVSTACSQNLTAAGYPVVLEDSTKTATMPGKQKSPTGAMMRALFFPGWGQFYNEQYIKSVLAFTGQTTLLAWSFYFNHQVKLSEPGSGDEAYYKDRRNLMYWLMGAVVLLSMLDAYIDAHLYDFDAGPDLSMRVGSLKATQPASIGLSLQARF
jgi:hypothetical protein